MPQINLLQPRKKNTQELWRSVTFWSIRVLLAVLVVLVLYYGYLILEIRNKDKKIISIETQMQTQQQDLAKVTGRDELFTRQQQLRQLLTLVNSHPYWSELLPALAKATLKTANYLTIQAMQDGSLTLSVSVPSTQDLDKFLQVFDMPEFNRNFYNIKIGSLGQSQVGGQLLTQFNVNMQYNPALLQQIVNQ